MIKISALPQFRRNAKRFTEIVTVLLKYGLANWLKGGDPQFFQKLFTSREGQSLAGLDFPVRLRMAFTELGTTFIKLGQVLSTRDDLISPELAAELAKLQADAPADPPEAVRAVIEAELGHGPEEIFDEFQPEPMGSASIGQVHAARLEGAEVVVKVRHPGISAKVATDLDILAGLASLAEKHDPELRLYQPRALVAEFRRTLLNELDFRQEARNLERFNRNFADNHAIRIPQPLPQASGDRVLTMERFRGFSIGDAERLRDTGRDTAELTRQGANIYLEMIFGHGFYHADPHPGNIWVLEDGRIGLLDCGMVGRLDQRTRDQVQSILMAALHNDARRLTDILLRLASAPADLDRRALEADVEHFVADYLGQSLSEIDLSELLHSLTAMIRNHHIILPADIALLIKTLVMLEGTSRQLSRDFNLLELVEPYLMESMRRRWTPQGILERLSSRYQDWDRLLEVLPGDLGEVLTQLKEGRLRIVQTHQGLDRPVNRLVLGLIDAALFLGSCVLLAGDAPPLLWGMSIWGLAAGVAFLAVGWRLWRAMKRSGGLD